MLKRIFLTAGLCCVCAFVAGGFAAAAEWHVASNGDAVNLGTAQSPWDLNTVLRAKRAEIKPGDTVWLDAGTYVAPPTANGDERAYVCTLSGTADKPIVIRAVPGARVTIDSSITALGHDVWFWGLELTNSAPRPTFGNLEQLQNTPSGGFRTDFKGDNCARNKLINCFLHNNRYGVCVWTAATETEVYGCLIYDNGFPGADRGHGHGVYAQNDQGVQRIGDNIAWNNWSYGIHCYAETADEEVSNLQITGNIIFSNGMPASAQGETNLLVGAAGKVCRGIVVSDNVSYMHPVSNRLNTKLYYAKPVSDPTQGYTQEPNEDLVCTGNVLINGRYALSAGCWKRMTLTGNRMYARSLVAMMPIEMVKEGETGTYVVDNNEYIMGGWGRPFELGWGRSEAMIDATAWRAQSGFDAHSVFREDTLGYPKGVDVYVRPNQYEPGRAHIAVLNWDRLPEVRVSLKDVLKEGQPYRVFNVQNLWDKPVASGTYDGKEVSLPAMLSWLAPEFDAYLVVPSAEGDGR